MDSVSQFMLGASVTLAVNGRKVPLWQSALIGGLTATLPDLDVFLDHGDAISNMTQHRTESHSLFWLTLISPVLAWLIAGVIKQQPTWPRWWLAIWLTLITHPLLDLMTVYGTQLGIPFTDYPYAISSMYIIDPLYTLPLIVGLGFALWRQRPRWNRVGLVVSSLYLGWSMAAQTVATHRVETALAEQGIAPQQLLVTPAAFTTLVWRVLIMTPEQYGEAWVSLGSPQRPLTVSWHDRHQALYQQLRGDRYVERVVWFSHGFYAMQRREGKITISDLRMGEEPDYTFTFDLGSPEQRNPRPSRLPYARPSPGEYFAKFAERW